METKKCNKCEGVKPLSEFYTRSGAKGGYHGQCKNCIRERDRERNKLPHRKEQQEKSSYKYKKNNPLKAKENSTRYNKKHSVEKKAKTQQYRRDYPLRYAASILLGNAVRLGKIKKPKNCSMCNAETKIHGHHEDYYKPLDVIWVCQACHKKIHKDIRCKDEIQEKVSSY